MSTYWYGDTNGQTKISFKKNSFDHYTREELYLMRLNFDGYNSRRIAYRSAKINLSF